MRKVVIHNRINQDQVPLYNPKGQLVGIIKNDLALNDVLLQIKRNKLRGYYIVWEGKDYLISETGRIPYFPNNLFATQEEQLSELMGF